MKACSAFSWQCFTISSRVSSTSEWSAIIAKTWNNVLLASCQSKRNKYQNTQHTLWNDIIVSKWISGQHINKAPLARNNYCSVTLCYCMTSTCRAIFSHMFISCFPIGRHSSSAPGGLPFLTCWKGGGVPGGSYCGMKDNDVLIFKVPSRFCGCKTASLSWGDNISSLRCSEEPKTPCRLKTPWSRSCYPVWNFFYFQFLL